MRRMRQMPRVAVDEQAIIRVGGADDINVVLLRDISSGGACIRTDLRLARTDSVWLRVNAGMVDQFELTAKVVTVRHHSGGFFSDYGLRLVEMNLESARSLERFILQRLGSSPAR
jgi:hypothetical protein